MIPVSWPAETDEDGDVTRRLTALIAGNPWNAGAVAVYAQGLARIRASREGQPWARVTMDDFTAALDRPQQMELSL